MLNTNKVRDTLSRRPHCRLVTHDIHNISDRIREIEPDYFILQNMINGYYEVHSTANIGDTLCFGVPYDRLDYRTLEYCRKTSVGRNVTATIEKNNDKLYKLMEHRRQNEMFDKTSEMADRLGYAMECDELHGGYRRTFSF